MREIKFRAWDKKDERMVKDAINCAGSIKPNGPLRKFDFAEMVDSKSFELMQYTGLKDKNGKEIYEGDIIKDERGAIVEIAWTGNGFMGKYPHDWMIPNDREIIGNIYQDKDLLDKEYDYFAINGIQQEVMNQNLDDVIEDSLVILNEKADSADETESKLADKYLKDELE
jgi:hypothetical protein